MEASLADHASEVVKHPLLSELGGKIDSILYDVAMSQVCRCDS